MLALAVVVASLIWSLSAATFVPAMLRSVGAMSNLDLTIPNDVSLAALEERSVVYAADGSVLAVLHDEVDRRVIPLADIPSHVRDAVLTAEDRKFWSHPGYDVEGIIRAAMTNARAGDVVQGGSTITQQLAKSLVGNQRTLERKISELTYAVALEERYSKEELLERYLNQVYLGSGAYGVSAAAGKFFSKAAEDLTPAEGALLAGLIRSPSRLDPRRNPDGAKQRRDAILREMVGNGFLHPAEAEAAIASPLGVQPHRERVVRQPYFVEAVKREFFANPAFGETRQDRINLLFTGGLEIHTTLEPDLQRAADEVVAEFFPQSTGPTAAIASVDPRDGRVLALASGMAFADEQYDLASQGRRQPGSSFKPFVLAAALENGFPVELRLPGSGPMQFPMPAGQEPWTVDNYNRANFGDMGMDEALVRSVNTAFAQLIMLVGPDRAAGMAERLGVNFRAAMGGLPAVPAIALGGLEIGVTPLEMASAYGVFANAGQRATPYVIQRVQDRLGEVFVETKAEPRAVLPSAVAGAVVNIMQDVVRRGTGTAAKLPGWEPAGKTGTTQSNADAWFIGAVPVMSTAVWVGHPDAQVPMRGVTGGSLNARIWQRFMTRALNGVTPVAFPETPPLSSLLGSGTTKVPDVRGLPTTEALKVLLDEGLVGQIRSVYSSSRHGEVIWQSPRDGEPIQRGSQVTVGVGSKNAPRPAPSPTVEETPTDEASEDPSATPPPTPTPSPSTTTSPAPSPSPSPSPTAAPAPAPDPNPVPAPTPTATTSS